MEWQRIGDNARLMSTTTIAAVADVVTRAASDSAFRTQLLSAPADTLNAAGIDVPSGTSVSVLENTSSLVNLVIAPKPDGVATPTSSPSTTLDLWTQLVADTWSDASLKSRLLEDPMTVLAERGISLPSGVQARVYEATDTNFILVVQS